MGIHLIPFINDEKVAARTYRKNGRAHARSATTMVVLSRRSGLMGDKMTKCIASWTLNTLGNSADCYDHDHCYDSIKTVLNYHYVVTADCHEKIYNRRTVSPTTIQLLYDYIYYKSTINAISNTIPV